MNNQGFGKRLKKKKKKYASRYMSHDKSLHNVLLENIS